MRFGRTDGDREKKELCDVKPFVMMVKLYDGVTHPSIECAEDATWEGPDCNS